jgi:hypothetical protein
MYKNSQCGRISLVLNRESSREEVGEKKIRMSFAFGTAGNTKEEKMRKGCKPQAPSRNVNI